MQPCSEGSQPQGSNAATISVDRVARQSRALSTLTTLRVRSRDVIRTTKSSPVQSCFGFRPRLLGVCVDDMSPTRTGFARWGTR
jgi:hypothetical protein